MGETPRNGPKTMILPDTNVLIYAFDPDSPFCNWASETIANAVAGNGAAINSVSLVNQLLLLDTH